MDYQAFLKWIIDLLFPDKQKEWDQWDKKKQDMWLYEQGKKQWEWDKYHKKFKVKRGDRLRGGKDER